MDYGTILAYIQSALMPLLTFGALLLFTVIRGRRAITSLILGLYFALLISLKFPYYDKIYEMSGKLLSQTIVSMILFAVFATACSFLMDKLLFYRTDETAFAGFGKKMLLALCATVLVLAYSYHVLPVTNLINPGMPASLLFAPPENFFWWLIAPLAGLFFL